MLRRPITHWHTEERELHLFMSHRLCYQEEIISLIVLSKTYHCNNAQLYKTTSSENSGEGRHELPAGIMLFCIFAKNTQDINTVNWYSHLMHWDGMRLVCRTHNLSCAALILWILLSSQTCCNVKHHTIIYLTQHLCFTFCPTAPWKVGSQMYVFNS